MGNPAAAYLAIAFDPTLSEDHEGAFRPTLKLIRDAQLPLAITAQTEAEAYATVDVFHSLGLRLVARPFANPFSGGVPYLDPASQNGLNYTNAYMVAACGSLQG